MGMEAHMANDIDATDSKSSGNFLREGVPNGGNGVVEPCMLMEMLRRIDLDLAFSSEKLFSLDLYVTTVSLEESEVGDSFMRNSDLLETEIEKALIFDLSCGYLNSEASELGYLLNSLRINIVAVHQKLCSIRQRETYLALQQKLHAAERSWKHLQKQLSELLQQLAKMHGSTIGEQNAYSLAHDDFEKSVIGSQTPLQHRHMLRMLDRSLSGELNLEKQLLESKAREKELKSELLARNKVVSDLESFVEVTLERLLEAEHSSEVFKGIAQEMMSHLHSLQFHKHCSVQREEELKLKLQNSVEQRMQKESALIDIENKFAKMNIYEENENSKKVKVLQEQLQSSESKLQEVNAAYEASQEQLSMMELTVESLREHGFMAETSYHAAEEKLATLTEENIELREELEFLKGGDSNVEKISLLQKQIRDLEVQLQTTKASSESSLEQQNMLYTAIWDMETLIEELRSKVFKAESRADTADQQCLGLAETNIQLSKEIATLKCNNDRLEENLKAADRTKMTSVKDINSGAKLITGLVMELARERERIQKQLSGLAKENKILLEELRKMRKICAKVNQVNKELNDKDNGAVVDKPDPGVSLEVSPTEEIAETPTSTTASNQVDEPVGQNIRDEVAEVASSSAFDDTTTDANSTNYENGSKRKSKHLSKKSCILTALFGVLFSFVAMNINWQDIASLMTHQEH